MQTLIYAILAAFLVFVPQCTVAEVSACDDGQCSQACISVGWDGGSCKFGRCWCWKRNREQRVEKLQSEIQPVKPEERDCDPEKCDKECGGQCRDEKCWCTTVGEDSPWALFHDLPTNFRDTQGKDVTTCALETCLSACRTESAFSGFCLKNLCWCTLTDEEAMDKRNVRPIIELQARISDSVTGKNSCHPSDCRRQCSNDNKNGGAACFYGYCWCDGDLQKRRDKQVRKLKSMKPVE